MTRSPERKKLLMDSVHTGRIQENYDQVFKYTKDIKRDINDITRGELQESRKRMQDRIEQLEQQIIGLKSAQEHITEEELDSKIEEFETEIDAISMEMHIGWSRPYWLPPNKRDVESKSDYPSYPPRDVFSRENLEKKYSPPLQWEPCKQDIGRILSVAMSVHEQRVKLQQVPEDSPITIVDVGGANGALGQLVKKLGAENGLNIHYCIVDPDQAIIEQAQSVFPDEFDFFSLTVKEFVSSLHQDPQFQDAYLEIETDMQLTKKKYYDLYRICHSLEEGMQNGTLTVDQKKLFITMLINDFQVEINDAIFENEEEFKTFFSNFIRGSEEYNYDSFPVRWKEQERQRFSVQLRKLESTIIQVAPTKDLVINSWMPPGIDLSSSIRQINGAAIMYFLARDGSTGVGRNSLYEPDICDEVSYTEGMNYRNLFGWVGRAGISAERQKSYQNFALVQARHDFADTLQEKGIHTLGLNLGEEYHWIRRSPQKLVSDVVSVTREFDNELKGVASNMPKDW